MLYVFFLLELQQLLKGNLKKKLWRVFEWTVEAGKRTCLNQIFTEVYITEGYSGEVNKQHEITQIEKALRKPPRPETPIKFSDIFKALPGEDEIRTVMMKGVAGIGKTVLTQKYILDWAENQTNQDIDFIFLFNFRELNLRKKDICSLVELLRPFFGETNKALICSLNEYNVVFIFDGLDEFRTTVDFKKTKIWNDVTHPTTIDVLLINLIRGDLLPHARIWITTRPAAACQIPSDYVDRVTEVRGFTNRQKTEFFHKCFTDKNQASAIITHIEKSRSLHIMCHIPVFCWITSKVLGDMWVKEQNTELPRTLCAMYIHFMAVHSKQKKAKYGKKAQTSFDWDRKTRKAILSLGKLAFKQLEEGNLIFYESDLIKCGIDIRDASVYSEVFTEIFKVECGLYEPDKKVFSFVHLSLQEFVAALYVFLKFSNTGVNRMLEPQTTTCLSPKLFRDTPILNDLYQCAVDKALESPNGHLDLFLRFLLGLSLESNRELLQKLLKRTGNRAQTNQETIEYIKEKIRENPSSERTVNLFHCLNELNDHSLEEEIQRYLSSGSLSTAKLSPAQCSALVFVLLSSDKELDVFDLKKYSATEEALLILLPLVKVSKRAL